MGKLTNEQCTQVEGFDNFGLHVIEKTASAQYLTNGAVRTRMLKFNSLGANYFP